VGGSPTADPLSYPGDIPDQPFVLDHGEVSPLSRGRPSAPDMNERHLVVAVGSNAAPARLVEKLGPDAAVPVLLLRVVGMDVRYSAHVTRYGAVPTTAWPQAGAALTLPALLLDDVQLVALDATEPNYDRVPLADVGVRLPSHEHQRRASISTYVTRRGWYRLEGREPALPPLRGRTAGRRGTVLGQGQVLATVLAVARSARPELDLPDVTALIAALRSHDVDLTPRELTAMLAADGRSSAEGRSPAA